MPKNGARFLPPIIVGTASERFGGHVAEYRGDGMTAYLWMT
jgi:hypothetical protein